MIFFIPLFVFFSLSGIQALDITGKELGANFGGEYNRSFSLYVDLSATGAIELNKKFTVKSGIGVGMAKDYHDPKVFTGVEYEPLIGIPLVFSLAHIYNSLPEFEAHSNTILPMVSFNAKRAGIDIGASLRFTSFFGETVVFEPILSFSVYVNFIDNEKLFLGLRCANFDDFHARNMGAYSLSLRSAITLNRYCSFVSAIEIRQSGSVGLSATFYGIAIRGGYKFSW